MLPRYRQRLTVVGGTERRRPRVIARILIALAALLIAWYLVTRVLAFFDYSIGRHRGALLTVRSGGDSVQVALQGSDWQRAESGLKLDSGDAVQIRGAGDAMLTFFDGTRIRLDRDADILVDKTDRYDEGTSLESVTLRSGRIWVATPSPVVFSGAITRTVETANFTAVIPAAAQVMISSQTVVVVRAAGLGVTLDLAPLKTENDVIVGEGQYVTFSESAKNAITAGADPYDYRDPILPQMLKDEFLAGSYALLSQDVAAVPSGSGAVSSSATGQQADLTLTSPQNHAKVNVKTVTVSGKISPRVALVLVNGQTVTATNGAFSVDVSVGKDPTMNIKVEAQDAQGIVLDIEDLTLTNEYKISVEPVRFKSPVGSGETLNTNQREIEITGEAPAKTAIVMVNDYKLQLYKPGDKTWSYLASANLGNLLPGANVFTVYAFDADGNRSVGRSITINFTDDSNTGSGAVASSDAPPLKQNPPLTPGVLTVTAPEAGTSMTTDQKEIVLEGTTSGDTASISINGYTLSLYLEGKTTWNYIASVDLKTLKRGRNVYRVVARDKGGDILDVLEYTITYNP